MQSVMSDESEERETALFTVSSEVAQAAIAQVSSCEECNPDAASSHLIACLIGGCVLGSPLGLLHAGAACVSAMKSNRRTNYNSRLSR
jgi:hypothetical protein